MTAGQHPADGDVGGDPVCWLHELCPTCGAVPTPEVPDRCWRCGTPVVTDPDRAPDAAGEHPEA